MAKRKTLVDSIYINNSGGKVLLDYLIKSIIKKGISDEIYFLLDPRGKYDYLDEINYEFGESSEFFRYKFYRKNKNSFLKVFCFGNVPPPINLNTTVYTYFHNVLLVKSVEGYPLKTKVLKYLKRIYIKLLSKNTEKFFVQSNLVQNLVEGSITSKKNVELFPFFSLNKHKKANYTRDIVFVYISNANPHKNHGNLLTAWESLFENGLNPKLHLTVTDTYPNTLSRIEKVMEKGINIYNHGYTDVNMLYSRCSHLIYPSKTESFGLGLVEAINADLDVIASDLPYTYEVIEPSLTFNPMDVSSIVDSVKKVINKEELPKSEIIVENKIDELIDLLVS